MRDPLEGLTATGAIRTGASRERIPNQYSDLLDATSSQIYANSPQASVYVYGSVATGTARAPGSDVDLLTVGVPIDFAASIGQSLSADFTDLCRGVEIAAAMEADFAGDTDEAYGNRVFLHHYCVRLAGRDVDQVTSPCPGDHRAARGFNGDIAQHVARWQHALDGSDAPDLGRTVARKALLAVAGLVSVHDGIWTTDRQHAALRWGQVHPELADGLAELLDWSALRSTATTVRLADQLANTIDQIVGQFTADIGLWPT